MTTKTTYGKFGVSTSRPAEHYGPVTLSVQASEFHYSIPRKNGLSLDKYSMVEIGLWKGKGPFCKPSALGIRGFDSLFQDCDAPVASYFPARRLPALRKALTKKFGNPQPKAPLKTNELINGQRIRCYDDGGKSIDRYTVVYMDEPERGHNVFAAVGMSSMPFHPQGFGQHTAAMPGKHLGKRIAFADLPADCQKLVTRDLTPVNS